MRGKIEIIAAGGLSFSRGLQFLTEFSLHQLLSLAILFVSSSLTYAADTYSLEIIAITGGKTPADNTIASLGSGPSINDNGKVAYRATIQTGQQALYVSEESSSRSTLLENFNVSPYTTIHGLSSNFDQGDFVQINNQDQICWRALSKDGLMGFIFRLGKTGSDASIVAQNYYDTPETPDIVECPSPFSAGLPIPNLGLYPAISLNNSGQSLFSGELKDYGYVTVLANPIVPNNTWHTALSDFNLSSSLSSPVNLYPMLADNGNCFLRFGGASNSPLYLFTNLNFNVAFDIADTSVFNSVGRMPGISDDGQVIAYVGAHKTRGAGIFANANGGRFKVAGLIGDAELPYLRGFPSTYRIAVNRSDPTSTTKYILAYTANADTGSPTPGPLGLYTSRVDLSNPTSPSISSPSLVAQVGDVIPGMADPIQDIEIYDPINNWGQLAFWVATATQQAIVRTRTVNITPLQVSSFEADITASDPIDSSIKPFSIPAFLANAPALGKGVVADGVTPVLFSLSGFPTNYTAEITQSVAAYNGLLSDHFYVSQNNFWIKTTNLTISSTGPTYAYLEGLDWRDFTGTIPGNQIPITLKLHAASNPSVVSSVTITSRPPPVILVHGYNSDPSAWSGAFTNILALTRPSDFIVAVGYGTDSGNLYNRTWSFDDLLPLLKYSLKQTEDSLHSQWAFTRYDIVGHSQGGVLARMLCQPFSQNAPIVGFDNFYRGRFRRVITIGSPHNGSSLLHYLAQLGNGILQYIPGPLGEYIQNKFDPFGPQVEEINDPNLPVDNRIRFNCIRTTVDYGLPPQFGINTLADAILGLCQPQPRIGFNGMSAGQIFLPNGYDSIVDFDSQTGGPGTATTTIPNSQSNPENIAHAAVSIGPPGLPNLFDLFGVPPENGQTTDQRVAQKVIQLLDADNSAFSRFYLASPMPPSQKALIESVTPQINPLDIILGITQPQDLSSNYTFQVQGLDKLPAIGPISWFAQVFTTNGLSSNGISLQINSTNPAIVTVSITNGVIGDVVLYASYLATNGTLIFGIPKLVVSKPAGTTLQGIELDPASATLPVGSISPLSLWGDYTNGTRSLVYTQPGQITYSSSDTNIATVNSNGIVTLNSFGTVTITGRYSGFTAKSLITSVPIQFGKIYSQITSNAGFQLSYLTTASTTNVIEASSNLVNWLPLTTNFTTNGFVQYKDSAPLPSKRFYRIRTP